MANLENFYHLKIAARFRKEELLLFVALLSAQIKKEIGCRDA